jgi:hypothetical protein
MTNRFILLTSVAFLATSHTFLSDNPNKVLAGVILVAAIAALDALLRMSRNAPHMAFLALLVPLVLTFDRGDFQVSTTPIFGELTTQKIFMWNAHMCENVTFGLAAVWASILFMTIVKLLFRDRPSGRRGGWSEGTRASVAYASQVLQTKRPSHEGTVAPCSRVEVRIDGKAILDAESIYPLSVRADANGKWFVQTDRDLENGLHVVSVQETDVFGKVSDATHQKFTVAFATEEEIAANRAAFEARFRKSWKQEFTDASQSIKNAPKSVKQWIQDGRKKRATTTKI